MLTWHNQIYLEFIQLMLLKRRVVLWMIEIDHNKRQPWNGETSHEWCLNNQPNVVFANKQSQLFTHKLDEVVNFLDKDVQNWMKFI